MKKSFVTKIAEQRTMTSSSKDYDNNTPTLFYFPSSKQLPQVQEKGEVKTIIPKQVKEFCSIR